MDFDSGPSAHQVFQEAFEEQQRGPVNGGVVDGERKMLYVFSVYSFSRRLLCRVYCVAMLILVSLSCSMCL